MKFLKKLFTSNYDKGVTVGSKQPKTPPKTNIKDPLPQPLPPLKPLPPLNSTTIFTHPEAAKLFDYTTCTTGCPDPFSTSAFFDDISKEVQRKLIDQHLKRRTLHTKKGIK